MKLQRTVPVVLGILVLGMAANSASAQVVFPTAARYYSGWASPYYTGYTGPTVYGDYLRGEAALYSGLGDFWHGRGNYVKKQGQYEVLHQQARRKSIANRMTEIKSRRELKQLAAKTREEKKQQLRQARRQSKLDAFRDSPGLERVSSGQTLNFILDELGNKAAEADFSLVELTSDQLAGVRLQTADGLGAEEFAQIFNPDGSVNWPESLRESGFQSQRAAIDHSLAETRSLGRQGKLSNRTLVDLKRQLISFEKKVRPNLARAGIKTWTKAKTFFSDLRSSLKELRQGGPAAAFDGTLAYRPHDTRDLMRHVVKNNLRFAPAEGEGRLAYLALHEVMSEAHRGNAAQPVAVALSK